MDRHQKLQIPVTEELQKKLKEKTEDLGFFSMNEALRLVLESFANGNITIKVCQSPTQRLEQLDNLTGLEVYKAMKEIEKGECENLNLSDKKSVKKLFGD